MFLLDNIQTNKIIDEIQHTYDMFETLFFNPYTRVKVSNLFKYQKDEFESNEYCALLSESTIEAKLKSTSTYISAIYYQNHHSYNPIFLTETILKQLPPETGDIDTNYQTLIECGKAYLKLEPQARYHYLRLYYYLNLPQNLSKLDGKLNLRTYESPLLFAPLFFSILHAFDAKKLSSTKQKDIILQNTFLLTKKSFFNYFDKNNSIIENIDSTKLNTYYSNFLDLIFPEDLFKLYCFFIEKQKETILSSDVMAKFDTLNLSEFISLIPHYSFLSNTSYQIFCSEVQNLWNTSDNSIKIKNVASVLFETEAHFWNCIKNSRSGIVSI